LFIFVTIKQAQFATRRGSILMGYDAALHCILQAGAYPREGGKGFWAAVPHQIEI